MLKKYSLIICGALGVIAAALSNVESISNKIGSLFDENYRYEFKQPILSGIMINNESKGLEYIPESSVSVIDVTISYEGKETLIIDAIELQHIKGFSSSLKTGQIASSGEYSYAFSYHKYNRYDIDPQLVINPGDSSLIKFRFTLSPQGDFYSSGGQVHALLGYQDGKGQKGVIPLVVNRLTENGSFLFPRLFDGDPYLAGIEYVKFTANKFGAIEGISRTDYVLTKKASGR